MTRTFTLILQFYRPLYIFNLFFTLLSVYGLYMVGAQAATLVLMIKLVSYPISIGYQYFTSAKKYFYFRNAGYSIRRMYAYTFTIDFLIYLAFIITCLILYHGKPHIES